MKKNKYRSLTKDEISYLKEFFKDSLDYSSVKIYNRVYLPVFHPKNGAMAPDGNIYIRGNCYRDNYGSADTPEHLRAFFLHEMLHVWQKQNNVMNLLKESISENLKHNFNYNAAYNYKLESDKDFVDYGMEQQASILEDYYMLVKTGSLSRRMLNDSNVENIDELYKKVLSNFLQDPKYVRRCKKSPSGKAYLKRKPNI